ncbi:MAG: hypothetical protein IPN84_17560 [Sphingomonadales bacterium]|nr:hypothetical protein [Sphingomonadales bacterium]
MAIIAEGATEVGFVTALINRSLGEDMRRYGIWVSDGGSNSEALAVLRGIADSGLKVAGFVDNEGTQMGLWQQVKDKLGLLLMRWDNGCLETNLIPHLADDQLEAFIRDPDGDDGERLRTLADRAGSQDKSLAAIQAATDNIRQLMIDAACGNAPAEVAENTKKAWKKHGQRGPNLPRVAWSLLRKCLLLAFGPEVQPQLLPFVNAARDAVGLPAVQTVD